MLLLVSGVGPLAFANSNLVTSDQTDPATRSKAIARYAGMPLAFEVNSGQTDPRVKAFSRGSGYGLFLTGDESVLVLTPEAGKTVVLRTRLLGANTAARVVPTDPLPGTVNNFIGNDRSKWQTDIATYAKMKYEGVYPGIDLVYYGNQEQLEYDFIVGPGADPEAIRFAVTGAKVRIDSHGNLVLRTSLGEVRHHKPVVYQDIGGVRREVAGRFVRRSAHEVAFAVAPYDRGHNLVIDPSLDFSTYLGGEKGDKAMCVAVDQVGNTIYGGTTSSTKFPTNGQNPGPYPNFLGGTTDAFLSVIFYQGHGSILYISSYFGGTGNDSMTGIALLQQGIVPIVYAVGTTTSPDMPTVSPLQAHLAGGADAFVAKLQFPNVVAYASYLGGSGNDTAAGITLDNLGNVIVVGTTVSNNFPTKNPIQATNSGNGDAFVTKFNSTFTGVVYSTYLGGSGVDSATGVANGPTNTTYIVGLTTSPAIPATSSLDSAAKVPAGSKAFIASLAYDGQTRPIATQIFGGNSVTVATCVDVDQTSGNIWLAGYTASTNFPTLNPIQAANGGQYDAFLMELAPSGGRIFATYWGGKGVEEALALALDPSGNPFMAGLTNSTNFPTANAIQGTNAGAYDGFVTQFLLPVAGSTPTVGYSTYLGGAGSDVISGIAVGSKGNATVAGYTTSKNFPVTAGVIQTTLKGAANTFATKIITK